MAGSPTTSPVRSKSKLHMEHDKTPQIVESHPNVTMNQNATNDDYFTMVLPTGIEAPSQDITLPNRRRQMGVEEDGFTMVIPSTTGLQEREQTPSQREVPTKLATPKAALRDEQSPQDYTPVSDNRSPWGPVGGTDEVPQTTQYDVRPEEVKVYEDPFTGGLDEVTRTATEIQKPVLEELPPNEQSLEGRRHVGYDVFGDGNSMTGVAEGQPRSPQKATDNSFANGDGSALQDRTELLRSRRLLASGIERIGARTLDAHGFRRLQELIKNTPEIWEGTSKFSELLSALLESLEAPPSPAELGKATSAKAQNLKGQVLATTRALLVLYRKEAAPYYARALCSVVTAKAFIDSTSHIAAELDKTADEIVRLGNISECVDSVLDLLTSIHNRDSVSPAAAATDATSSPPKPGQSASEHTSTARTVTAALTTLTSLLRSASGRNISFASNPAQTQRLGGAAVRSLSDVDPDVRKAALDFCVELHERLAGDPKTFWKALAGTEERHLNLITYYLARKGTAA